MDDNEYTLGELTDMVIVVGECKKNISVACQVYRARYPGRNYPDEEFLRRLVERFHATGDVFDLLKTKSGCSKHRKT